jgi:hypothetical protein
MSPERAPRHEDFEDVREFVSAHEAFHDAHPPTTLAILERAVRLGSDSLYGIALQVRRLKGKEPEDEEWWARIWIDFQFLIVVLWRMRQSGVLAKSANIQRERIRQAISAFDTAVPDLKRMRDVAQHFEEYAVDGPGRRHLRPRIGTKVGRRMLEVGSFYDDGVRWLDGVIDFPAADLAARDLYLVVRAVRNDVRTAIVGAEGPSE